MRELILAFAASTVLAAVAFAATPETAAAGLPTSEVQVPKTLILPTTLIAAVRRYLGSRPHDEVAGIIDALEACVAAQLPRRATVQLTHGMDCPPVSEALSAKAAVPKTPASNEIK
jgi:hypothetical protein